MIPIEIIAPCVAIWILGGIPSSFIMFEEQKYLKKPLEEKLVVVVLWPIFFVVFLLKGLAKAIFRAVTEW